MEKFSELLKQLRWEREISQQCLALATGINIRTIQRYESGEYTPGLENLLKIAAFFGKDVDFFVDRGAF